MSPRRRRLPVSACPGLWLLLMAVMSVARVATTPAVAQERTGSGRGAWYSAEGTTAAGLPAAEPLWGEWDGPTIWAFDDLTPWVQRFGIAHESGDGPGFDDGFTTLEFFTPLRSDQEWEMTFIDARGIINDSGDLGLNLGAGHRIYVTEWNRIFGVNAYFDRRGTDLENFKQAGIGVESLGPLLDFRGNVYIPDVGPDRARVANRFVGNQLIINRDLVTMPGVDYEVGVNTPQLLGVHGSVAFGGYHFDGRGNKNATGWKGRVQVTWDDWMTVEAKFQDDDLFGETMTVGVAVRYRHRFLPPTPPAERSMDHRFFRRPGSSHWRDISHRLSEPVQRLQNIVLTSQPRVARDATGAPLTFLHVVQAGAGDGTFENPYGSLSAALADAAAATSVIYTPQGGDFTEDVTLIPGARVFSNGPIQHVQTSTGRARLPFSGASTDLSDLPTITGNITFADDSQLSGFEIDGQVTANGVSGFRFENSVVDTNAGDAITLTGVSSATLERLLVDARSGRGILLDDSSAELTEITVTRAMDDAIEIVTAGTDRTVTISDFTAEADGIGIDVQVNGGGQLDLILQGSTDIETDGTAFSAVLGAGSTGDLVLSVDDMMVSSGSGTGFLLDGSAGAGTLVVTSFRNNQVSTAGTGGALFQTVTFDSDLTAAGVQRLNAGTLTISSAQGSNAVTGDGLSLIDTTGSLSIDALNLFNTGGTGLLVDTSGGGTVFELDIAGGTVITGTGPAMSLTDTTANIVLGAVQSTSSPTNGVFLDGVSGRVEFGTANINVSTLPSVMVQNTPSPLTVDLGVLTITSTISDKFADNVDTSVNNGGDVTIITESVTITEP